MIDFIEGIAARTGLPVGIKSAIGEIEFWDELADRMKLEIKALTSLRSMAPKVGQVPLL